MFAKRFSRVFLAVLTALLATLTVTSLAWAGGWAVITLDRLPENVVAGQPYALGFMVRQHGRTPWQVDQITILASQAGSGQSLTFTARPDAVPGHYQAKLLFPQPGAWEWSIQSGLYPDKQPMPALRVAAAGLPVSAAAPVDNQLPAGSRLLADARLPAVLPGSLLGIMALLALIAGAVLLAGSRAKGLRAYAGAGLLVLCGGLGFAFFTSVSAAPKPAAPAPSAAANTAALAGADSGTATGQALFLAKGCVACHVNTRAIENAEQYSVSIGPNLTTYHNDPQYLKKWLTDPGAVKPGTGMPALGLSPAEIDALVAFLNSD